MLLFLDFTTKEIPMMKTAGIAVVSLCVLGLWAAPFALAAPAKQSKMAACNAQANDKGLGEGKGDPRKAFMKECLSAKPAKAVKAGGNQQNKMKSCNKEAGAKGLKGDDRKTFMSTCLSN
jgi:psiF repeat